MSAESASLPDRLLDHIRPCFVDIRKRVDRVIDHAEERCRINGALLADGDGDVWWRHLMVRPRQQPPESIVESEG